MTTTTVQHEPWCTEHVILAADPVEFIEENSWCRGTFWRGDPDANGTNVPEVTIEDNGERLGVVLEVFASADTFLTPAQAREMAAALVQAAAVLEGLD